MSTTDTLTIPVVHGGNRGDLEAQLTCLGRVAPGSIKPFTLKIRQSILGIGASTAPTAEIGVTITGLETTDDEGRVWVIKGRFNPESILGHRDQWVIEMLKHCGLTFTGLFNVKSRKGHIETEVHKQPQ